MFGRCIDSGAEFHSSIFSSVMMVFGALSSWLGVKISYFWCAIRVLQEILKIPDVSECLNSDLVQWSIAEGFLAVCTDRIYYGTMVLLEMVTVGLWREFSWLTPLYACSLLVTDLYLYYLLAFSSCSILSTIRFSFFIAFLFHPPQMYLSYAFSLYFETAFF